MRSFISLLISLSINLFFFLGFWYSIVTAKPQTYGYSELSGHTMIEMLNASVEAPPPSTPELAQELVEEEPDVVKEAEPDLAPEPEIEEPEMVEEIAQEPEPQPDPEPVPVVEPEPVKKMVEKEKEKPKAEPKKKPKEKKQVRKKPENKPKEKEPKKAMVEKKPNEPKFSPQTDSPKKTNAKEVSDMANSQPASNASANPKPSNQPSSAGGSPQADAYKSELRNLISRNKRYPSKAQKMRKEGTVVVSFAISKGGSISNIRVSKSSGNKDLDKAAVKAVRRVGTFKPRPDNVPGNLSVPINFKIKS